MSLLAGAITARVDDGESAYTARYRSNRKLLDWGHW